MTLWILLAVMSLVAVGFAVWPLYRHQRSLSPLIGAAVILVVALSSGLYYRQGSPDLPSGGAGARCAGNGRRHQCIGRKTGCRPQ